MKRILGEAAKATGSFGFARKGAGNAEASSNRVYMVYLVLLLGFASARIPLTGLVGLSERLELVLG